MKAMCFFVLTSTLAVNGFADPQIASWYVQDSGKYARIYRTDADRASGRTEMTWSNGRTVQSDPAFCGVQEILSSANWIYVCSTGLGGQVMGPWLNGRFPNLPTDQHFIFAIPRHPTVRTSGEFNPMGEIGMFVDGVRMFDATDAFSYSHENGRDADPRAGIGQGDHVWNRDAYVNESRTFDAAMGHQQQRGTYHYHAEPIALRYQLGDHVDFDAATQTYHESTGVPVRHSPILGWMQDGYPLYGPYGYSNSTNPASGVRRMISGYVLRDGHNGTDNLAQTGRTKLPAWEAREHRRSATLPERETGPEVSDAYPLGRYIEDYAYLGDLGKKAGKDFDLDELNGRWCETPEFPNGTYAYFTTIDADGNPVYPYNMGRSYHGNPVGRLVRGVFEPVTTNFVNQAGERVESNVQTPKSNVGEGQGGTRTMMWDARQGGYGER